MKIPKLFGRKKIPEILEEDVVVKDTKTFSKRKLRRNKYRSKIKPNKAHLYPKN